MLDTSAPLFKASLNKVFKGWRTGCACEEVEGELDGGKLQVSLVREAQWSAQQERGEEDSRRLEELRRGLECFDVDAYCGDADGFDGAG